MSKVGHLVLGLFSWALFWSTGLPAQVVENVRLTPAEPESLFIHLGVGIAEPARPPAFSADWTSQVTMYVEALYYRAASHTLSLRLEYSTFVNDVETLDGLAAHAELTSFSIQAATSLSRPTRWGWPYIRFGAGLSRIKTRRVEISDGFVYRLGIPTRWQTGMGLDGGAGWTLPLGAGILLMPELAYRADYIRKTWLGYGSLRIGVALSPSLLVGRLRGSRGR